MIFRHRRFNLLIDASRLGLTGVPSLESSEEKLLRDILVVSKTQLDAASYPSESELGELHDTRRNILADLTVFRRQARAARSAIAEASGFEGAVSRQRDKLMLSEHLKLDQVLNICPVCESPSEKGREVANTLRKTLDLVRSEYSAIERIKPDLIENERIISDNISRLNNELRTVDEKIKTWIKQNEEASKLSDISQMRAHLLGRISFFLESIANVSRQKPINLDVLRSEIEELESRLDREAKEIKLRYAEGKISQYASENFGALPTVAPCIGSELEFSSRQPDVSVIEAGTGTPLRLSDIGSDQNYLAIHIALSFALQHYFERVESPVPGVLILDQISRPYFPNRGDDLQEISGGEEDEDIKAMRKHIDFIFSEVERRTGLQVILIEHAYFSDEPRYVKATRKRWTRKSQKALIPFDWPTRKEAFTL